MASQPSATLGARLMARRKELGWSLQDVEAHLKVRLAILQAIEEGDYSRLPDKVYVLGFVKNYARLLGFEGEDIMHQANRELSSFMPKRQTVQLDLPGPQEGRSAGLWILLGIGLVVIVGAYVGWYHFSSHGQLASSILPSHLAEKTDSSSQTDSSDTPSAEPPEERGAEAQKNASAPSGTQDMSARQDDGQKDTPDLQPAPEVVSPTATAVPSTGDVVGAGNGSHPADAPVVDNAQQPVQVTAPMQPAEAPKAPEPQPQSVQQAVPVPATTKPAEDTVSILVHEDSWVQVTDASGKVQLVRVLKKGEVWQGKPGETYRVTSGNAGGVVFQAGNVVSAPLGLRGRVVRNVTVDAASVEQGHYGYGALATGATPASGSTDKSSQ